MAELTLCLQAVLEDVIDKVGITASLSSVNGLRALLPETSGKTSMDERKAVEHGFRALLADAGNGDEAADATAKSDLIAKYHGMRRKLDDTLHSATNVAKTSAITAECNRERALVLEHVERALSQLREIHNCPRLREFVREEKEARHTIDRLTKSLTDYETDVKALEAALDRGAVVHEDKEMQMSNAKERLKETLRETKSQMSQDNVTRKLQAQAAYHAAKRMHEAEIIDLQERLKQARQRSETESLAWQHTQQFMTRKIAKAEATLQEWTERHEREVQALVTQLQQLTDTREQVLDDLRAAQEQYDLETQTKQTREEFERKLAEVEERRRFAVVRIQSMWRGFEARKAFKKLKKEASSSKKKGGAKGKPGKK